MKELLDTGWREKRTASDAADSEQGGKSFSKYPRRERELQMPDCVFKTQEPFRYWRDIFSLQFKESLW